MLLKAWTGFLGLALPLFGITRTLKSRIHRAVVLGFLLQMPVPLLVLLQVLADDAQLDKRQMVLEHGIYELFGWFIL